MWGGEKDIDVHETESISHVLDRVTLFITLPNVSGKFVPKPDNFPGMKERSEKGWIESERRSCSENFEMLDEILGG